MLINRENNVIGVFRILNDPKLMEGLAMKDQKHDVTEVTGAAFQQGLDGVQQVYYTLKFIDGLAVPAMGIKKGMVIIAAGRTSSKEYFSKKKGKFGLEYSLYVEYWAPRLIDPLGVARMHQERFGGKGTTNTTPQQ